jgi:uncharacterized protein (DUF302 family)
MPGTPDRECLVFQIGHPQQAKTVLDDHVSISSALPCRISVYQEGGKTKLTTLLPFTLLSLFPNLELMPVAEEVEKTLSEIMEELAG